MALTKTDFEAIARRIKARKDRAIALSNGNADEQFARLVTLDWVARDLADNVFSNYRSFDRAEFMELAGFSEPVRR